MSLEAVGGLLGEHGVRAQEDSRIKILHSLFILERHTFWERLPPPLVVLYQLEVNRSVLRCLVLLSDIYLVPQEVTLRVSGCALVESKSMVSPDSCETVLQGSSIFHLDRNKRVLVVHGHNILEHGPRSALVVALGHELNVISVDYNVRL